MGKIILGALIGAAIVVAGFMFLNKPEPTPEEKLKAAIEDAGESAQEVADAATELAGEMTTALATSASAAATDIAEQVSNFSNETKAQFESKLAEWKAAGIISESGFDFDKAAEALKTSSLSEATKQQINDVLELLKTRPEEYKEQLDELKKQLDL